MEKEEEMRLCGCKSECFHEEHPHLVPQRECRRREMADKWVKPDSQYATGAKGAPTPRARVSKGIADQKSNKTADEKRTAKVIPAKSKDKLSNKRR